jgi:hypothetical protein
VDCCEFFEDCCECCDCCEDSWFCCHDLCSKICVLLSALLLFLCGVVIIAWWTADITAFTENTRLDGNGCPLKYDL